MKRPDGTSAFGTWTGGWLGVMSQQVEDVSKFMDDWFVRAETARAR